jgi:hypothetical protein
MKGEEIEENELIGYCIIMFSVHIVLNIVMAEQLNEEVRE